MVLAGVSLDRNSSVDDEILVVVVVVATTMQFLRQTLLDYKIDVGFVERMI